MKLINEYACMYVQMYLCLNKALILYSRSLSIFILNANTTG